MHSRGFAALVALLTLSLAVGASSADARKKCRYCGTYQGSLGTAADPTGNVSGDGTWEFTVNRKGVMHVGANGTWICSHGEGLEPQKFDTDRFFKKHPVRVKKNGHFAVDHDFGDLRVSFYGHIKKKKFTGYFAMGFLRNGIGCGTSTLPATASK